MIIVVLVPVVLLLVLLVAVFLITRRVVRGQATRAGEIRDAGPQTLRYVVPDGQDPTVVLLGLSRAGYEVVPDSGTPRSSELLIGGRDDEPPDRERVRTALAGITQLNLEEDTARALPPVRFADE